MVRPAVRPFPWVCGNCGKAEVVPGVGPYRVRVKHADVLHDVEVNEMSSPRCGSCGEVVIGDEQDRLINEALREKLGLLSPGEMLARREALGVGRAELAARLGVAEETLALWERGALIQSTASDRLLRLCFDVPEARAYLGITGSGLRPDSAGAA